jgi:hypothetical protein
MRVNVPCVPTPPSHVSPSVLGEAMQSASGRRAALEAVGPARMARRQTERSLDVLESAPADFAAASCS